MTTRIAPQAPWRRHATAMTADSVVGTCSTQRCLGWKASAATLWINLNSESLITCTQAALPSRIVLSQRGEKAACLPIHHPVSDPSCLDPARSSPAINHIILLGTIYNASGREEYATRTSKPHISVSPSRRRRFNSPIKSRRLTLTFR